MVLIGYFDRVWGMFQGREEGAAGLQLKLRPGFSMFYEQQLIHASPYIGILCVPLWNRKQTFTLKKHRNHKATLKKLQGIHVCTEKIQVPHSYTEVQKLTLTHWKN